MRGFHMHQEIIPGHFVFSVVLGGVFIYTKIADIFMFLTYSLFFSGVMCVVHQTNLSLPSSLHRVLAPPAPRVVICLSGCGSEFLMWASECWPTFGVSNASWGGMS